MFKPMEQFCLNIDDANSFGALHAYFEGSSRVISCVDNLLRAKLVFYVGALDTFVHDVVRTVAVRRFFGGEDSHSILREYAISLNELRDILDSPKEHAAVIVDRAIRRANGYKSFQTPDSISKSLASVGVKKIWKKMESYLGQSSEEIKNRLQMIVERRNKIVHESDIDPTYSDGYRYLIDPSMVARASVFIENICNAMFEIVCCEVSCGRR